MPPRGGRNLKLDPRNEGSSRAPLRGAGSACLRRSGIRTRAARRWSSSRSSSSRFCSSSRGSSSSASPSTTGSTCSASRTRVRAGRPSTTGRRTVRAARRRARVAEHAAGDTAAADVSRTDCRTIRRPASRSATRTDRRDRRSGEDPDPEHRSTLLPILGVGSIGLKAKATMRLEHTQDPTDGGLITRRRAHVREARSEAQTRARPGRRPLRDAASGALRARRDRPRHRQLVRPQAPSADAGRRRGPCCGSGFSGCFSIRRRRTSPSPVTALSYAGDTAREPRHGQPAGPGPGNIRVTLNSQRYWAAGIPTTPTTTGYGTRPTPVGDNSAGTPARPARST